MELVVTDVSSADASAKMKPKVNLSQNEAASLFLLLAEKLAIINRSKDATC